MAKRIFPSTRCCERLKDANGLKSDTKNVLLPELIDGAACYIDVGSTYPGSAEASKGAGVHRLKGIVSWVQNAVRQFV